VEHSFLSCSTVLACVSMPTICAMFMLLTDVALQVFLDLKTDNFKFWKSKNNENWKHKASLPIYHETRETRSNIYSNNSLNSEQISLHKIKYLYTLEISQHHKTEYCGRKTVDYFSCKVSVLLYPRTKKTSNLLVKDTVYLTNTLS